MSRHVTLRWKCDATRWVTLNESKAVMLLPMNYATDELVSTGIHDLVCL